VEGEEKRKENMYIYIYVNIYIYVIVTLVIAAHEVRRQNERDNGIGPIRTSRKDLEKIHYITNINLLCTYSMQHLSSNLPDDEWNKLHSKRSS